MPSLQIKSSGAEVFRFYDFFAGTVNRVGYAASYAFLLGKRDGYFGLDEERFVKELQRRLNASGVSGIVIDGIFGDRTAAAVGYRWTGTTTPPVVTKRRKIWIYSCPGSGANWDQGPSFDLGVRCKDVLNLNHQPVYFQKGGYLGFLGGDPSFSYNEVTWDQYKSIEALMDMNADVQEALRKAEAYCASNSWNPDDVTDSQLRQIANTLEYEQQASGYSQSAEGLEAACEMIYGDGDFIHPGNPNQDTPSGPGKYRLLRHCLKLVVQFGNPSTAGSGIARKVRSSWLANKIRNVNYDNDFYAVVPQSDKIRPAFYAIIVEAEMELPFFVHVLRVSIPIISAWAAVAIPIVGPMLGGFGPMMQLALGMITGAQGLGNNPLLGGLLGQAGSNRDTKVDADIIALLTPTGLLSIEQVMGLIGLVAALPGLEAHGRYPFDPVMMDRAYAHIAGFRR